MRDYSAGKARGFTLLEVLVAMTILAVALAALIKGGSDHSRNTLRLADLQVTLSVLERDLAQIVDISVRDEFGDRMPPLRLRAGGDSKLLEIVRAGAGGDQRLRRTAWLITDRGLERQLWPGVDIADAESARVQPFGFLVDEDELLGMETGFALVVRTATGLDRLDAWPPAGSDPSASQLPLAVEIVLDIPGYGEIRRLMAVGL